MRHGPWGLLLLLLGMAGAAWGQSTMSWTIVEERVTLRIACELGEGEVLELPAGEWVATRVRAYDADECCTETMCLAMGGCPRRVPTTVTLERKVVVEDGVVRMPKIPCASGKVVP